MGKKTPWWEDPEIMKNAPKEIREAAEKAAEQDRTFGENDTDAGTSGDATDTRN